MSTELVMLLSAWLDYNFPLCLWGRGTLSIYKCGAGCGLLWSPSLKMVATEPVTWLVGGHVPPNLSWHPIFPGGLVLPHTPRPKQAPPIPLWESQTQTYTILLMVISSETKQPAQGKAAGREGRPSGAPPAISVLPLADS